MTHTSTDPLLPLGWEPVPEEIQEHAKAVTLAAITYAATPDKRGTVPLARYYDIATDYAGATFATLAPIDPYDITATDLHAVRLLSVPLGPAATRRLLDESPRRTDTLKTLSAVPADLTLADAGASTLEAMANFYEATRRAMKKPMSDTSDPWVTATKLTARKRPDLIPVRDNLVRTILGLTPSRDYHLDWQVMRALANDPTVLNPLEDAVTAAQHAGDDQGRSIVFDTSVLRLLDVALWEYARATLKRT